ncbi:hypothetical protein GQ44DRAFT_755216 [Phaeosphaeriaceae sp. PMI808]|nr:hypothetical protein GQ44DRAFT_755216 [Phaeosphaeriaceae sp. PMI808]
MATAAVRSAGEEFLASWLAKDRNKYGHYYTSRIPKHAAYGSLIHIPITNCLLKGARYLFRGRTSPTSRFLAILFGLLVVAPIQKIIFFAVGAIIAGARTADQVRATVRAGFSPAMKVVLLASPIAVAFASNFLPERFWPKFFDIVNLAINTYANAHVKKKRLAALRKKHYGHSVVMKEEKDESDADSIDMPTTLRSAYPLIPRGNPVVVQGNVILDAAQFVMPTPIQPIYPPNSPDRSAVGQADVVSYRGSSHSSDSAAEGEETELGTAPIRTPSPYQLYYRPNRSVAEGEGVGPDTGQPGAVAEAITTRPLYSADTWQTLDTRDNSSDSDREEKRWGSEIDSDTSSDLPSRLHGRKLKPQY